MTSTSDHIPAPVGLRFVVLRHEGIAEPHFDLMFEMEPGGMLATWRSPRWPIDRPTPLTPLPPHRREYLAFEGELSNGRGSVRRIVTGMYRRTEEGAIEFIEPSGLSALHLDPKLDHCFPADRCDPPQRPG